MHSCWNLVGRAIEGSRVPQTLSTADRYGMLSRSAAVKSERPWAWIPCFVEHISARSLACTSGCRASSKRTQHNDVALVSWPASSIVLVSVRVRKEISHCKATNRIWANISPSVNWVAEPSDVLALTTRNQHTPYRILSGNEPSKLRISLLPLPWRRASALESTSARATAFANFAVCRAWTRRLRHEYLDISWRIQTGSKVCIRMADFGGEPRVSDLRTGCYVSDAHSNKCKKRT